MINISPHLNFSTEMVQKYGTCQTNNNLVCFITIFGLLCKKRLSKVQHGILDSTCEDISLLRTIYLYSYLFKILFILINVRNILGTSELVVLRNVNPYLQVCGTLLSTNFLLESTLRSTNKFS